MRKTILPIIAISYATVFGSNPTTSVPEETDFSPSAPLAVVTAPRSAARITYIDPTERR